MEDKYGCSISAGDPKSLEIWNSAMSDYLDFSGTPVKALQSVEDSAFLLGPVFCAAMRILGGAPPDDPNLQSDLQRVKTAAHHASKDEAGHAVAVNLLSQGEFSQAAREWDKIILQRPNDLLAHKCAHETWFLVGDIPSMLASTTAALGRLTQDDAAYSVAVSQHAFALEESGDYASAEGWARLALDLTPSNCWALHALAHVYETQNRHVDSMALFEAKKPIWEKQNLLNVLIFVEN